jgi:uncharacterized protein
MLNRIDPNVSVNHGMPANDILFLATIAFLFATVIGIVGWALSGDLPRRIDSGAASSISTATVASSSAYSVRGTETLAAALHHTDPPKAMLMSAILGLPLLAVLGLLMILFLGGSTKGALGIGLPIISVPLAAQFLDLPLAIGLLTLPMISTNIWQAFEGGSSVPVLRRLWPIIGALVPGTLAGAYILISIDRHLLNAVVGVSLVLIAGLMLCQTQIRFAPSTRRWGGPLIGLSAGLLGGTSGMHGPLLIAYFVGLDLHPDVFVKQISILFLAAAVTLLLTLGSMGSLSTTDLLVSAAAMVPIQLGLLIGGWLRRRIQPAFFRAAVLCVLASGGIDLVRRAFF